MMSMSPSSKRYFNAVYSNNLRSMKAIIKREKINPNIADERTERNQTALLFACEHEKIDLARVLLTLKPVPADVNKPDKNGKRPVWWAAKYGNVELAELLINEFKCEVDYFDSETGYTPLYAAILTGSTDTCSIIIQAGANVNLGKLGANAEPPLMKVILLDDLEICKVLVNSGCDLNYKTEEGFTALHYTVAYRRYSITEFLLQTKINRHAASNSGVTAMTIAIEHLNPIMVRLLVKYGYNMNKSYGWKETPLEQAIMLHNEDCALVLVYWGCKLTNYNKKPSYLYMAANAGLIKLISLLTQLKPSLLNDRWIKEQRWPPAIVTKPELCDLLTTLSQTPQTLKSLSRSAIFSSIRYFPDKYSQLPLPKDLIEFISFSDLIDDEIYKESPLEPKCPMDCNFLHAWRDVQCPDIEISDIDGLTDSDCSIDFS